MASADKIYFSSDTEVFCLFDFKREISVKRALFQIDEYLRNLIK